MNLETGIKEYSAIINQYRVNFLCKYNPDSDEVILFIHGLACSLDSFRNIFDNDYFPDKSLLMPDLVGFGKSSKPKNFSYKMELQAALIEELLSILPIRKIHIVAHSMGGAIALLFSADIFSRIESFTNIEGNLVGEDCGILSRGIISVPYDEYRDSLFNKHLAEFQDHPQLHFNETTPFAVYYSAASLVEWSDDGKLIDKFKNLDCKKCYFYGEENKNMPVLERLDFVKKYLVHNSGHGMTTENPKEFYASLAEFIYSK